MSLIKFKKSKYFLILLIPFLVLFDQLSKIWILKNIFLNEDILRITNFLNFVPVWNKGISFGMLSNLTDINLIMIFVTLLIISIIFFWFLKTKNLSLSLSLILIISGALGNLFDRLNHKAVVDFIDVHIGDYHWPAFNLADSYITLGAIIYIYIIFTSQTDNIA